jgi:hypothetical protein
MKEGSSKKLKENRPERCCMLDSTNVGGNQAKSAGILVDRGTWRRKIRN